MSIATFMSPYTGTERSRYQASSLGFGPYWKQNQKKKNQLTIVGGRKVIAVAPSQSTLFSDVSWCVLWRGHRRGHLRMLRSCFDVLTQLGRRPIRGPYRPQAGVMMVVVCMVLWL